MKLVSVFLTCIHSLTQFLSPMHLIIEMSMQVIERGAEPEKKAAQPWIIFQLPFRENN